jgi:2-aminoadipate transaminase
VGSFVQVEDPAYPGLKNIFERAGVRLSPSGDERAPLIIVTPNFHNPTGLTMSLREREDLLRTARDRDMTIVEIDIYSALRYRGDALPSLAELDPAANVIQVGSFSKIAFPGLRIGWIKARREVISRLAEAKQWVDLHSDQLSQAILLKFAESGKLEAHRQRVVENGRLQLTAVLESLEREMPSGTQFTRPDGGMNLWVTLPEQMDAAALLPEAQRAGVNYLPARFFEIARRQPGSFRLSFGGLAPERIAQGVALLGKVFRAEVPAAQPAFAMAMV